MNGTINASLATLQISGMNNLTNASLALRLTSMIPLLKDVSVHLQNLTFIMRNVLPAMLLISGTQIVKLVSHALAHTYLIPTPKTVSALKLIHLTQVQNAFHAISQNTGIMTKSNVSHAQTICSITQTQRNVPTAHQTLPFGTANTVLDVQPILSSKLNLRLVTHAHMATNWTPQP